MSYEAAVQEMRPSGSQTRHSDLVRISGRLPNQLEKLKVAAWLPYGP